MCVSKAARARCASALDRIGGDDLDMRFWDVAARSPSRVLRRPAPAVAPVAAERYAARSRCRAPCCSTGAARNAGSRAMRPPPPFRHLASVAGGHATCFTPSPDVEPFHPLAASADALSPATEAASRSARHFQSRPNVRRLLTANTTMQTNLSEEARTLARAQRKRKRSCAHACIAVSAMRPARPISCSATNSTGRADASI